MLALLKDTGRDKAIWVGKTILYRFPTYLYTDEYSP
jgi:hypothetical protein